MIHIIPRRYRDRETDESKTKVFVFGAESQEEYETKLEAVLQIPLPGKPIENDGEDGQ